MKINPFPFLILLALPFLFGFAGRNKGVTDPARREAILSTGRWKLTDNYVRYTVKGKEQRHSKWHTLDTCFKDNQMKFGKTKVYYDQGLLKCNAAARRIDSSFTWRLDNEEGILWMESQVYTQPLYIEYLSDSFLEVNEFHFFGDSAFIKVYSHIL